MDLSDYDTITMSELRVEPNKHGGTAVETREGLYLLFKIWDVSFILAERRKRKPILFKSFQALTRRYLQIMPDGERNLEYRNLNKNKKMV